MLSLKTPVPVETSDMMMEHPLPTWVIDADRFTILFANQPACKKYGISSDGFLQKDFLDLFTEDSRPLFFYKATRSENLADIEGSYTHLDKKGNRIIVALYLSSLVYNEKDCYQVCAVDITSKEQAIASLQEDSNRYKTFIEYSIDGIYCQEFTTSISITSSFNELTEHARKHSYVSECNLAMARMYGFEKADELKGILLEQLLDFDAPANYEFFKAFIDNGFRITDAESHEKDRHGNTKYILNNLIGVIEDGYLKRIWGTQQDITEKKNTDEKLKMLASLVEQTSDVLTAADINFKPLTWNKAAETVYGLTAEQAIGHDLREYFDLEYTHNTRQQVRDIIKLCGEWRGETYFTRPVDKKIITLLISFKQMQDENGVAIGYLVSASDITERKEAESRLKESENRFREMADSSAMMIWMSDEKNITTYTNKKWCEFTGKEIAGDPDGWESLVHKDDLEKAKSQYFNAFRQKKEVTINYRLLNADGTYRWVHDISVPRFSQGEFIGYIGSVLDVEDERQKKEQLLYQATILENVSDVVVTTDLDHNVKSWNASAELFYNIKEKDAIGRRMSEMLNFDFLGTSLPQVTNQLRSKGTWKGEVSIEIDGQRKYFLYNLSEILNADNKKIGFLAIGRDITEMKLAQDKMEKSEQFYRTLIADSLDGMILMDLEGTITFASPSVKNVLGYESEEVRGKNAFEFVHPDDFVWASQSFELKKEENSEVNTIVVRFRKKNGEWLWCQVRGNNMLRNPNINSVVIYFHDDSRRKQASDALKESEKRFRNLIRELQIGVFLSDIEGNITMCNQALADMLGLTEEMITGANVYDFMNDSMIGEQGEMIPREERPMSKAVRTKVPVKDFVMGVFHPVTRERAWILVNSDPILDDNGEIKHIVSSVMNITERKKLEQKLLTEQISHQRQLTQATIDGQEAERKEIGKELHDNIGQQLTTIKLFLDFALTTADDSTNEMVSMALKGVGDVINEVRAMSRSLVPSTLQDLGLMESITELADSISRTQVMEISVCDKGFEEDILPENQKLTLFRIVQEQLNNIVKHAEAKKVSICLKTTEKEIVLQITDNGKGFDPAKVKRGLGFLNIRNRAELFGGKKQLISAPGEGCLLKLTFPHPGLYSADQLLPLA